MESKATMESSSSSNTPSFTIIHLISILIGLTSAAFLIAKEIQDENNPADRTLYSLPLLLAGILFFLKLPEKVSPNLLEVCSKKNETLFWDQEEDAGEKGEEKFIKLADSSAVKSSCNVIQPTMQLFPYFFFAVSSLAFVHNVIDETRESEQSAKPLFLYTVPTGLMTGILFDLTFTQKSSNLVSKLQNFIRDYRNILFLGVEYFLHVLARNFPVTREALTVPPASFWGGFNGSESVKKAVSNRASKSVQPLLPPVENSAQNSSYTRYILPLATFSLGVGLTATAMSILEKDPLRNAFALWLASIGEYFITDPIGRYFSHCIPEKSHKGAITFLTYFLIICGNAKLTSADLVLLLGAGICGGLAQPILNAEYNKKIILMQRVKEDIDTYLTSAPEKITQFLRDLDVEKDPLLLEYRKKHRSKKIAFNVLCGLFVVVECGLAIISRDNKYTVGRVSSTAISMPFMLILFNYILPYGAPSKNTLKPLSFLQRIFYTEVFFWYFLAKVAFCMTNNEEFINNEAEVANAVIFNVVVLGFLATTVHKHFYGSYKPYLPRDEDIAQLKIFLNPQVLNESSNAVDDTDASEISDTPVAEKKIILNYYLLQFVRENCLDKNKQSLSFFAHLVHFKNFVLGSTQSKFENMEISSQYGSTAESNAPTADEKRTLCESNTHIFSQIFKRSEASKTDSPSVSSTAFPRFFLACEKCPTKVDVQVNSNDALDSAYVESCTNISGRLTLFDTAIRGPRIRDQFNGYLELPQGLNLLEYTSYVPSST